MADGQAGSVQQTSRAANVTTLVRSVAPPPGALLPITLNDATIDLALAQQLGPALGAGLAAGRLRVPAWRRDRLVWEHQMCAASHVVRERAVQRFASRCREANILLLALKGFALVRSAVEPAERSMGDVDLLVPASRWTEACHLAEKAGFLEPRLEARRFTMAHDYVRTFTDRAGVTIEVHRYVCDGSLFRIAHADLFSRARSENDAVGSLDEGDLFLTLAAHAAKHTFDLPLRSLVDGIFLLRRRQLDWGAVLGRAVAWRMTSALSMWLQTLAELAPDIAMPVVGHPSPWDEMRRWVWAHTSHDSPWQRFLRLAWLTDSRLAWMRHVMTRGAFRGVDLVVSTLDGHGAAPKPPPA